MAQLTLLGAGIGGSGGSPPPSYTGPGDVFGGAYGYWGLRAYTNALAAPGTTKAVRLRRDSDNTEQDFVVLSTGAVDVASITTFKGAANLFVVTLYDQAGVHNVTQSTAGSQPSFILSGNGSLPVIRWGGAQQLVSASFTQGGNVTFACVAKRTSGTGYQCMIGGNTSTDNVLYFNNSANQVVAYNGGLAPAVAATDNVWHNIHMVSSSLGNFINVDTTITTDAANAGNGVTGGITLGGIIGVFFMTGDMEEAIFWPGMTQTQTQNVDANMFAYWGTGA